MHRIDPMAGSVRPSSTNMTQRGATVVTLSVNHLPLFTVAVPGDRGECGSAGRGAAARSQRCPSVNIETDLRTHIGALLSQFRNTNRKECSWNSRFR